MLPKHYFEKRIVKKGLQADSSSSSINPPIIPTFRDVANLIECVAMFYFFKGLSVFRIVTEPCADRPLAIARWFLLKMLLMPYIHTYQKRQAIPVVLSGLPVLRLE